MYIRASVYIYIYTDVYVSAVHTYVHTYIPSFLFIYISTCTLVHVYVSSPSGHPAAPKPEPWEPLAAEAGKVVPEAGGRGRALRALCAGWPQWVCIYIYTYIYIFI